MALGAEWLSLHLTDPAGNWDQLLTERVRPTVRSLWQEGRLESFFFVRHLLGGPHLRLRIRPAPGSGAAVRAAVHDALAESSIQEIPFEPEVERYGGLARIGTSLDFFALSSIRALGLLGHRGTVSAGEWLTIALRLTARHLLGFAEGIEDLKSLIAAPEAASGPGQDRIREGADRAFQESGDRLVLLLRREIEKLGLAALSPLEDGEVARCLARELGDVEREARLRIFASQIHMTANRLGLATVEEAYVGRILWRAFRRLQEMSPATWSDLVDLLVCRAERDPLPMRLHDLLPLAFATL